MFTMAGPLRILFELEVFCTSAFFGARFSLGVVDPWTQSHVLNSNATTLVG